MDPGSIPWGKFTDIKIFNKVLCHFLDPGEQVEAYEGYVGHPDKIKCPQIWLRSGQCREGEGVPRDAEWVAKKMGGPLPGISA